MKRILCLILSIAMLLTAISFQVSAEELLNDTINVEQLRSKNDEDAQAELAGIFDLDQDGDLFYDKTTGEITYVLNNSTYIEIPELINGVHIVGIAARAFWGCSKIISVTVPDSIIKIDDSAFDNCNLTIKCNPGSYAEQWAIEHGKKYMVPNASIFGFDTNQTKITVYENKNVAKDDDEYILSESAEVTAGDKSYPTNINGSAMVDSIDDGVVVKKNGFVNKTVTKKQLDKNKTVYLQRDEGDYPIINGVVVDNVDVLTHDYEMDLLSTDPIGIKAEVIWKGGSYKRIYLEQEGRRAEFSGDELNTVLSDHFNVADTIYIVAEDSNGKATKKELKFEAGGQVVDLVNEYKLSFGDNIGGTIPDSVPVIGGSSVGIEIPMLPLNVTFENNKFYATLGIDVDKYSSKDAWASNNKTKNTAHVLSKKNKTLFTNIKDDFKKTKNQWDFSRIKQKFKTAAKYSQGSFAFNADFMIIGYIEGYVSPNSGVEILDGGVIVNPSIGVDVGSQIWALPPVYWEASIKGEIEAMYNIYLNKTAKNFMPRGSVGGKVTLKGGLGLGVSGAAGISGGVEGSIGIKYDMYERASDNYIAISGSIGAYAKIFIGPITLLDKSFPFAEGIIWDHPSTRSASAAMFDDIYNFDLYDETQYKLNDRSYAANESLFVANEDIITAAETNIPNRIENIIKTNTYSYSEPQFVEFDNGNKLIVWVDDNRERSDINRTSLYYSYYNGKNWSSPSEVLDDGTADYMPQLKLIDNKAYLVWVNTNAVLENTTDINYISSHWDISAAVFNGMSFADYQKIGDYSTLDMMPTLFGSGSDIYIAWVNNKLSDIFGQTNDNAVMLSKLDNGQWSAPRQYSNGLYSIDSLSGSVVNNNVSIAYAADMDGNANDNNDKEIYYNNIRLTNNNIVDSKVYMNNEKLYWYTDNNIMEYDTINGASRKILSEPIYNDRFKVISNSLDKVLLFTEQSGLYSEVYAYKYDSISDKWSDRITLTNIGQYINDFSGVISKNGDIDLAINKAEVLGTINDIDPYGQSDLSVFIAAPSCDLSIDDVYIDDSTVIPGNTLEFESLISNNGDQPIYKFKIEVFNENGDVLAVDDITEPILPGESKELLTKYVLMDEGLISQSLFIKVTPDGCTEYDQENNSFEVELNYNDISLENVSYGKNSRNDIVIYGDVVNRGYGKRNNITVKLHENSPDGVIVDTYNITSPLSNLDIASFEFYVPYEMEKVYYVTIDSDDMMLSNNESFVVLSIESENPKSMTSTTVMGDDLNISLNDVPGNAVLIAAVYGKNGELISWNKREINSNSREVNLPIELNDAYEIRVFVWDNIMNMKPISVVEKLTKW